MTTLQLVSLLIAAAALFGWVSIRVLRLPLTIGIMLLTVLAAAALELASHWFPGLHPWALQLVRQLNFERLILHGMLALLLFAGSVLLDLQHLARQKLPIVTLALAGTLLSAAGVAAVMHAVLPLLGLNAPWMPCLFFGALLSPTDPIAVLEMLRRVGAPAPLQAQLAGESLLNDGIGAVLFLTLLSAARGQLPSAAGIAGLLAVQVGGGLALGVFAAWITSHIMRRLRSYQVDILLTLALALGGYALADTLHLSAPLEAVAAGIAIRTFNRHHPEEIIAHERLERFWEVIDEIQNAVLFVLLGLEVLAIAFSMRSVAAGGLAIATVLAVRFVSVAALLALLRLHPSHPRSSALALTWGGLRGGLSLALALSVPAPQSQPWLLPATYLVVLFSVVLQGGSMDVFLRRRYAASPPEPRPEPHPEPAPPHP